ncbi:hypothetical protein DINM_004919 [Dirofilaria immitis]|nr:hypothetical protein [Dirofilaria immitis]
MNSQTRLLLSKAPPAHHAVNCNNVKQHAMIAADNTDAISAMQQAYYIVPRFAILSEIVPLKIMVEVGNDNYFRHIRITAQSICIKIISEFSQGAISPESVIEFSLRTEAGQITKEQLIKLYRIIFGTAFSILKGSMKTKLEFNRYTFDFALQILNNIFENLKVEEGIHSSVIRITRAIFDNIFIMISNYEGCGRFAFILWSVNSRCLIVGDSEISNAVDLERIATFEANFVRFMLSNTTKRKNLFSKEHQRELAFMITFFISKFCSQKVDMTIRLSLGNTLLELVKPWDESIETITSFLPGICCRMTKLACTDLNTVIVDMALKRGIDLNERKTLMKIFGCTVSTCLNDSIMHKRGEIEDSTILGSKPENSENVSGKNICYVENWNKNLKLLFRRMCSRLIQHQDYRIRLTLLVLLYDVYRYCTINLASSIENILIDAVLLLLCDPYEKIAKFSGKVKEYLMHTVNESFISRLMERLYSLSISISTETIVSGDVEGCLKQFLGVLLSMNSGCNDFLLIGGKLPELLTSALSSTLQLNAKRLRLSREVTEKSIIDELPLLYNVKKKTVNQIAMLLVTSKQSHASDFHSLNFAVLLDCISANIGHRKQLDELTNSYHFAIYLLRAACTQISKPPQKFIDTLQVLVEQAVKLIERIDIHHPPRDDIIEDDNDEQDIESCLITVLLSFYAAAFICTPSIFLCQKLMNETLFEIFKWTKSSYLICAESAEHALKAATVVAIRSRAYNSNLRTPCVLSSLLDHCNTAELFEITDHVVQELLLAEWLILILRALLSFAMAIGKWFPDVRPQEIEYDEDNSDKKAPKPSFVESINNVLKRTKHLLFSSYVPIRLLILKIVDVCLKDLRYFPDDYLPMIHQNWLAVLDCLQMKNLNVRLAGFKVVVTMCELSGSFCYRRFIPQAWPSIRKFMLEQITTSANAQGAYFHSAIYKFQQAVLENLDVVFRYIEARNADWRSAVEMAKAYCDVTQPKTLQTVYGAQPFVKWIQDNDGDFGIKSFETLLSRLFRITQNLYGNDDDSTSSEEQIKDREHYDVTASENLSIVLYSDSKDARQHVCVREKKLSLLREASESVCTSYKRAMRCVIDDGNKTLMRIIECCDGYYTTDIEEGCIPSLELKDTKFTTLLIPSNESCSAKDTVNRNWDEYILEERYRSYEMLNSQKLPTRKPGTFVIVSINAERTDLDDKPLLNCIKIVNEDLEWRNGTVQLLSAPLPQATTQALLDIITSDPDFSAFSALLTDDLRERLASNILISTVFVFNNETFASLSPPFPIRLRQKKDARKRNANNTELIRLDNSRILNTDRVASNGVIHIIDDIILPEQATIDWHNLLMFPERDFLDIVERNIGYEDEPVAIFIPPDNSFRNLTDEKSFVMNHIVINDSHITNELIETAYGSKIPSLMKSPMPIFGCSNTIKPPMKYCSTTVYSIDAPLPRSMNTLKELINSRDDFSVFASLLNDSNVDLDDKRSYTVFYLLMMHYRIIRSEHLRRIKRWRMISYAGIFLGDCCVRRISGQERVTERSEYYYDRRADKKTTLDHTDLQDMDIFAMNGILHILKNPLKSQTTSKHHTLTLRTSILRKINDGGISKQLTAAEKRRRMIEAGTKYAMENRKIKTNCSAEAHVMKFNVKTVQGSIIKTRSCKRSTMSVKRQHISPRRNNQIVDTFNSQQSISEIIRNASILHSSAKSKSKSRFVKTPLKPINEIFERDDAALTSILNRCSQNSISGRTSIFRGRERPSLFPNGVNPLDTAAVKFAKSLPLEAFPSRSFSLGAITSTNIDTASILVTPSSAIKISRRTPVGSSKMKIVRFDESIDFRSPKLDSMYSAEVGVSKTGKSDSVETTNEMILDLKVKFDDMLEKLRNLPTHVFNNLEEAMHQIASEKSTSNNEPEMREILPNCCWSAVQITPSVDCIASRTRQKIRLSQVHANSKQEQEMERNESDASRETTIN